jgi:hypothetical protein
VRVCRPGDRGCRIAVGEREPERGWRIAAERERERERGCWIAVGKREIGSSVTGHRGPREFRELGANPRIAADVGQRRARRRGPTSIASAASPLPHSRRATSGVGAFGLAV